MDPRELARLLAPYDLDQEADALAPFTEMEIGLFPRSDPAGRSRLGGSPDLPAGFEWPCHRWRLDEVAAWPDYAKASLDTERKAGRVRDEAGFLVMPMTFVAQIDLAEVPPSPLLPDHGLLYFFAAPGTDAPDPLFAKRVASAARWADGPTSPVTPPPTVEPWTGAAIAIRAERRPFSDPPWEERDAVAGRVSPSARKVLEESLCRRIDALLPPRSEELAGPVPPRGEVSLFRLVDHTEHGFPIGDVSWLTFSIPEGALLARRFEEARATVFIG